MKLLYQIDWLAPWPEAGSDHLTFYRQMSAAYSQRLALAKQYIEQSEHRPGCMYPCTCGRDALLKAMTPDQPSSAEAAK